MEEKVREMVDLLNFYRDEYYNRSEPSITDAEYDALFDELTNIEKETGIYYPDSPTQSVGFEVKCELGDKTIIHKMPVLSLERTKSIKTIKDFVSDLDFIMMHKIDGITIKAEYQDGILKSISTRGNGVIGYDITDRENIISGIPNRISYKDHLVVLGEGFIHINEYEALKDTYLDSNGNRYIDARNMTSGMILSNKPITNTDKKVISFYVFQVMEGIDSVKEASNSKIISLESLQKFGFELCDRKKIIGKDINNEKFLKRQIEKLKKNADDKRIPIDGIVFSFDNIKYSASLGRTTHHYNDSIAYKF